MAHPNRLLLAGLVVAVVPLASFALDRYRAGAARDASLVATVPQPSREGYAKSDRCEACHPSQYQSWHRGYHRTMTTYATPETVHADFSDQHLEGGGYDARIWRSGDDFMVDMVDPLWQYEVDFGQRMPPLPGEPPPRVERRIAMVTGSHHMQAFWVPSEVGNGQLSLPFTYLFDDKRWVPRGDVFLHPPDARHQEQVWNVSCITCHTTGGEPGALVGGKQIASRVGEMGIACEACHGPGDAHVAANANPLRRYWLHARGGGDPTIVNPARLDPARASDVCGSCHGLTDLSQDIQLGRGKTYVPGDELAKSQPLLRPLHPTPALERYLAQDADYLTGYFWADGTIRVSSRDYSGMIESKCTSGGKLWCGSCHSLHESDPNMLVARDRDGDAACTQCHPNLGAEHTHHAPASVGSRCENCHMPHTVYGLLKGIRNHRIDSPHVTGKVGGSERPNACNLCHLDRSLAWTAQQLASWYKQPVATGLDDQPAGVTWLLAGDAVLRAIAAWHYGWDAAQKASDVESAVPYLLTAMTDEYAAVRYVAGHAYKTLVPASDFDYLAEPDVRDAAVKVLARGWAAHHKDADIKAITARIKQLADQRDESPVRAME